MKTLHHLIVKEASHTVVMFAYVYLLQKISGIIFSVSLLWSYGFCCCTNNFLFYLTDLDILKLILFSFIGFCMSARWVMFVKHGKASLIRESSGLEGVEWRWESPLYLLYVCELVFCLMFPIVSETNAFFLECFSFSFFPYCGMQTLK